MKKSTSNRKIFLYIALPLVCLLLMLLNHWSSYSRRIGHTPFYLVETMATSKEGKPLAGLFYKPSNIYGYVGEQTSGFPLIILWNENYLISKNYDGCSTDIIKYMVINLDRVNTDSITIPEIYEFTEQKDYDMFLQNIGLSEADMKRTNNYISWFDALFSK